MNRSSPRQRANLAENIDGCSCAPFEIERSSYMCNLCNLIMAFTIKDALSTNEFGMLDPGSRNHAEHRSLAMLCYCVECMQLEKCIPHRQQSELIA
jgi:hypothetical protein